MERLTELWEEFPDQRFGQLLMNLSRYPEGAVTPDGMFQDVWEWDVEAYTHAMRRFAMLYRLDTNGGRIG
jgi:hypothetical protein